MRCACVRIHMSFSYITTSNLDVGKSSRAPQFGAPFFAGKLIKWLLIGQNRAVNKS